VPLNAIDATIHSIRITLLELDLLPDSKDITRLKSILHTRIAELEQLSKSGSLKPANKLAATGETQ